jgi:PAS domain S-box-containing protein
MVSPADILKGRILIVDDLAANVAVLEQMLERAGYTAVTSTKDPYAVAELHRQHRYDLILLDLQMPGMDGFQVMEALKKIEMDSYPPVLVITAQPDQKLRALKAGAKDFISKPFDLTEVLARVHNMLEIRLLHRRQTQLTESRLETSQRIAGLGDWEYDFTDHRLLWSEEVYRILGLSRNEVAPDSAIFYRQVHPDDLERVHREKKAAADGAPRVDFEHRLIGADGQVRHIHQITSTTRDAAGRPLMESGTLQDITERKVAEAALRRSEERFRALSESAPLGIFELDATGGCIYHNPAMVVLSGRSLAENLGQGWKQNVHPEDRAAMSAGWTRAVMEGKSWEQEQRLLRPDGTIRWVHTLAAPNKDSAGRITGFVGMVEDITARRQAEEELREKTALLEAQIDSSMDGILIVNPQGRRLQQNERYNALMKIPWEIASGRDDVQMRDYVLSQVREPAAVLERVLHLYAHPREASREEIELLDGTVLDRYSSPILSKEGRNYGRIWAFRDITANKAADLALRESEERFKFVARAVSDAVWDWNVTANTVWWNEGFFTAFGFAPGEIAPSFETWNGRIHPEDRGRVVESIRAAIAGTTEAWSADYRFERKDGSFASVVDHGYLLRDAAGRAVRMVGGLRDLTEQKKMEEQYLRAQRMDSIGTLAGGIAHDLNNVLAPILMSIELLKLGGVPESGRTKILDTIHVSCRRGADLVRQVMSFARGADGQRVPIRLRHLVGELEAIISETFPRNLTITIALADSLWPVMGDPTQIHQILLNLTVNARDAMPAGGELRVSASNLLLDAHYAGMSGDAKPGSYVLLEVSDTGTGIPPEVRDRIFEPFYTTKEIGKGTGLGLATVHTIVRSHGGFITVESEVGRGSTFRVYLPADPGLRAGEALPAAVVELPRGHDELVLVVDDEFSIREIMKQTLEAFGYRVIIASDGAEAVALFAMETEKISLVITDMMMPVMDGAAAIRALIALAPDLRLIAASGIESGQNVDKAASAGVTDFLVKPFNAEKLLRLVREVLDRPDKIIGQRQESLTE